MENQETVRWLGTMKIYYDNPYRERFDAKVLSCEETGDGSLSPLYAVVLHRTAFYPREFGLSPDTGTIGDANVLDVRIEDGIITHYTDKPLSVGETVIGKIDFDRRFSDMQQHSAEHLFSGLVHSVLGLEMTGMTVSEEGVTAEYDGELDPYLAYRLEEQVNDILYKNIGCEELYPSEDELEEMDFRGDPESVTPVRLVSFEDVDVCVCSGAHVRRTGEIGVFKVLSVTFDEENETTAVRMAAGGIAYRIFADLYAESQGE